MDWTDPHPMGTEAFLSTHPHVIEADRTVKCEAVRQDTARTWGHCKTPGRWLLNGRGFCSVHADIRLRAFNQYYGGKR